jgi:BirA family transcriptional regulator, biotin operon repressor / biotin---[acetyl-CoA-carboxylase] ligase
MDFETLKEELSDIQIGSFRFYEKIGSTNDDALHWADTGAPDMSLVITDEQTAGCGSQGRKWYTHPGSALAFSLVLRLSSNIDSVRSVASHPSTTSHLTALGAIAICKSLQNKYNLEPQIKWPNDVLLRSEKVAGILTETRWKGEELTNAILGIGVNVSPDSVPPDEKIVFPATCVESVFGKSISRTELLCSILENLTQLRTQLFKPEFMETWNQYLAFRGNWILLTIRGSKQAEETHEVQVIGLDPQGGLKVRTKSGNIQNLFSGEISLKFE